MGCKNAPTTPKSSTPRRLLVCSCQLECLRGRVFIIFLSFALAFPLPLLHLPFPFPFRMVGLPCARYQASFGPSPFWTSGVQNGDILRAMFGVDSGLHRMFAYYRERSSTRRGNAIKANGWIRMGRCSPWGKCSPQGVRRGVFAWPGLFTNGVRLGLSPGGIRVGECSPWGKCSPQGVRLGVFV